MCAISQRRSELELITHSEQIQRIDANTEDVVDNVQGAQRELMKYWSTVSGNRWLVAKMFGVLMVYLTLEIMQTALISGSRFSSYYGSSSQDEWIREAFSHCIDASAAAPGGVLFCIIILQRKDLYFYAPMVTDRRAQHLLALYSIRSTWSK